MIVYSLLSFTAEFYIEISFKSGADDMIASNLLLTSGLSKCSKPKRGSCFKDLILAEVSKASKSLSVLSTDKAAPFKSND